MWRSHIDHYVVYGHVFCLQKRTIHRRQWQSWKAHEKKNIEEMVMATVLIGEYVQTMGREAASAVFPEVICDLVGSRGSWLARGREASSFAGAELAGKFFF